MNVRWGKLLNLISNALIGFNLGFCLALFITQWTWLELRFNAGLFILLGLFLGLITGFLISLKHSLVWGGLSVAVLILSGLVLGQGIENMQILLGSVFREGVLMPSLTLITANYIIVGITLLTVVASWGLGRLQCLHRNKV
jgi:hypothetical protein